MPIAIESLLNLMPLLGGIELSAPEDGPLPESYALPEDLAAFWGRYGGALLYGDAPYATRLFSPSRFSPTDEIMWEEPPPDTLSESWFIVGDDANGNDISIDLSPDRLGWCYDTQLGRYGSPGDCPIIARSLTEFLRRTLVEGGRRSYWLREDFTPYGDAYDETGDVAPPQPRAAVETVEDALSFLEANQPMAPDAGQDDPESVARWLGAIDLALGIESPDPRLIPPFLGSIPSETEDDFYRETGLLLRRYPGDLVVPTLAEALGGANRSLARFACEFAVGFRDRRLTEALLRSLSDGDERIRLAAASTLLVVGGAGVTDSLRRVLEGESNPDVRGALKDAFDVLERL